MLRRSNFVALFAFLAVVAIVVTVFPPMLPPQPISFAYSGGMPVNLADYKGSTPTGVPASIRGADLITRGRYLTQAADCEACHTAVGGVPYSGGRAFRTPFGTLYAPNITPDRATAIGDWSDADFLKAMHDGIAPGEKRL